MIPQGAFLVGTSVILSSISLVVNKGLPNFRDDFFIRDEASSMDNTSLIYALRSHYEEMPDKCRKDQCLTAVTSDSLRGSLYWRETRLGWRLYVRCPYSVWQAVYAHRDCILDDLTGNSSVWGEPVYKRCPGPPLTQVLGELSEHDQLDDFHAMEKIAEVIEEYPDAPSPTQKDLDSVLGYLVPFLVRKMTDIGNLTSAEAQVIMKILEVSYDRLQSYLKVENANIDMIGLVVAIVDLMEAPVVREEVFYQNNHIRIHILTGTQRTDREVIQFGSADEGNSTSITLQLGSIGKGKSVQYTVRYLQFVNSRRILYADVGTIFPSGLLELIDYTQTYPASTTVPTTEKQDNPILQDCAVVFPSMKNTNSSILLLRNGLESFGPLTHLSVTYNRENDKQVYSCGTNVTHTFYDLDESFFQYDPICYLTPMEEDSTGIPIIDGGIKMMADNYCETVVNANQVTCHCSALGYLALYTMKVPPEVIWGPDFNFKPPNQPTEPNTVVGFLGFEFNRGLHIVAQVMRPISITCLLLTIMSYGIFKKTRRGSPTTILINLCVSLIALLVIVYIAQLIGGTRRGCVASNVLRFYFIFVSLMWNAVEAYNLYLKLVKVFNSTIVKHFILKAGLVAWGLPLLLVVLVIAADQRGFHGHFEQCEGCDYCVFRCQLPPYTLYYGYILPMSLIIAHNLIIFIMVMRVLIKQGKRPSQGDRNVSWMRLVGAISILVLIGVPWIFSAFGALEPDMGKEVQLVEFIMQVIFVVAFNLQGMFIFIFHCARIKEIRSTWGSSVARRITYFSTGNSDSVASGSNTQAYSSHNDTLKTNKSTHVTSNNVPDTTYKKQ